MVAGNPAQVLEYIEFDWGRDNYVRWRANDFLDTGYNSSQPYRIWVNSEPVAAIIQPGDDTFHYSDVEIVLNGSASLDLDGDNLSYFWSSNIAANRSLGNGPEIIARLAVGNHTITLFVSDGNGYNVSDSIKVNIGIRPKEPENPKEEKVGDILLKGKGGDSWIFYLILAGIVLLILVIIIALIVRKKKKKRDETEKQIAPSPAAQIPSPYPQGQYLPDFQQGYSPQPMPGMNRGPPPLALPPGPQPGPTSTAPQNTLQLPQYNTGQPQALPGAMGMVPGQPGEINYLLPSFPTIQGDQDLNIMALPPGPDMSPPDMLDLASLKVTTGSSTAIPDPSLFIAPETSPIYPLSPEPASPVRMLSKPPSVAPPTPKPPGPPSSPSTAPVASPLSAEDPFPGLPMMNDMQPPGPPPGPPEPPTAAPEPPGIEEELTMSCHACGNDYKAVITCLPAVVTCSHCMAQGMVEYL